MKLWIRKSKKIDPELRKTLDQYGLNCMQIIVATTNFFIHGEKAVSTCGDEYNEYYRESVQLWLTEQYQRKERQESWLFIMEMAITGLVAIEAWPIVSGWGLVKRILGLGN